MHFSSGTFRKVIPILAWLFFYGAHCQGQSLAAPSAPAETSGEPQRSIEDLNLVGSVATMPAISDTLLGTGSAFREALYRQGVLFRVNALPRLSVNLLDGPVPAGQQVYVGQRPTWITGLNPIFTADLRQLGLRNAQLHAGFAWRWTNWNPAGPKTTALSSLYLYKMWGEHRVEMKAGYLTNDVEFVGLQVGGSLATAAQGVYAVLPYQVGMSYFPLASPALNVRVQGPGGFYVKSGAQRSLDPAGGLATVSRNPSGLRFLPKGYGLLLINEAGYQRPSRAGSPQLWIRAGYLHNRTRYPNRLTAQKEAGNYCVYALADRQLTAPDPGRPGRGLYLGGSVMSVPSRFNSYARYYEARLYQKAPFRSRPDDVLSLVGAYRGHSNAVTAALEARGKTVWHNSPSLTASYAIHVARGTYMSLGLGYVRGAAITPRVADSLTFSANWSFYL